jgi:YHS domain-containing protein
MLARMTRTISSLALTLLALTLVACGGSTPSEKGASCPCKLQATAGSEGAPVVAPGEAGIGDRSTCPVSGEEFLISERSPTVEHEGRTYYFCCHGCAKRFEANPAKYLEGRGGDENPSGDED